MARRQPVPISASIALLLVAACSVAACSLVSVVRHKGAGVWLTLSDGVTAEAGLAAASAVFADPDTPEYDGALVSVGHWIWVFGKPSELDQRCLYSVNFDFGRLSGDSYCVGRDEDTGELVVLEVVSWIV